MSIKNITNKNKINPYFPKDYEKRLEEEKTIEINTTENQKENFQSPNHIDSAPISIISNITAPLFENVIDLCEKQMKLNSYKDHWSTRSNIYLFRNLLNKLDELEQAETRDKTLEYCADAINYLLMIVDNEKRKE